jgi:hypothetical protein
MLNEDRRQHTIKVIGVFRTSRRPVRPDSETGSVNERSHYLAPTLSIACPPNSRRAAAPICLKNHLKLFYFTMPTTNFYNLLKRHRSFIFILFFFLGGGAI